MVRACAAAIPAERVGSVSAQGGSTGRLLASRWICRQRSDGGETEEQTQGGEAAASSHRSSVPIMVADTYRIVFKLHDSVGRHQRVAFPRGEARNLSCAASLAGSALVPSWRGRRRTDAKTKLELNATRGRPKTTASSN